MGLQWAKAALMTFLRYFGYFTAGGVQILPVFNTFKKVLSMKSVGGGTRVEPLVASLLVYACSLILASVSNKWDFHKCRVDESFWVNGFGTLIYLIYLGLFLWYADRAVRLTTLRAWAPAAAAYLAGTTIVGMLDEPTVGLKWLSMIAGVASSFTPLALLFLVMEKTAENLPDWFSSTAGLLNYTVWIMRALPKPDVYDVVQNLAGVASAVTFLVLLFRWKNQNEQRGDEYEHLLGNRKDHLNIQVEDLLSGNNQAQDGANNIEAQVSEARTAPPTPEKAPIHRRSASA